MSKAKKLDIPMHELIRIAKALNENTIANKSRSKDDKINTDTFIKQFGINRKDFSETIKDTSIVYNKSTFQYAFDDIENLNNGNDTLVTPSKSMHSETLVSQNKTDKKQENDTINKSETMVTPIKNNDSETIVIKSETIEKNLAIVEFENMKSELVEMLEWYKSQKKKENIIDIEIPLITIDKEKLTEQAVTRGFKIYPNVVAEFKEFCNRNSQYNMQDLMAMALIEYMEKYKK
jgi:hypothetical protein